LVEILHHTHHGETTDELGNQTELHQILGQHLAKDVARDTLAGGTDIGTEADPACTDTLFDDAVEPCERTATDEQDVRRVDLNELLVRMLASTLRWD
jgi:hypothetical protein